MPPNQLPPDSPQEWLRHARSDLAVAAGPRSENALPVAYCFHAQQAAEKAIKAVYIARGVQFPFIHNIRELLDGLNNTPPSLDRAARLTPYAVESRYPADLPDATDGDLEEALELARAVVEWAEGAI